MLNKHCVGCTSEVVDALVCAHQSANSRHFRRMCVDLIVYTLPAKNIKISRKHYPPYCIDFFKIHHVSNLRLLLAQCQ